MPVMEGNLSGFRPVYQSVTQTAPGSFEAFYHGTSGRLLRYAYGLTGDMAEAQDFTQEAYVRAWQRWKRLRDYDNPESWLRLVVTRLATDRWRWLRVRGGGLPPGEPIPPPGEDLVHLVAELKRLPMPQRRALVLHYLLDRPVADIARETGVSVNTVKSWLLRGRASLAARLAETEPAQPLATTVAAGAVAERGRRQQRRRNTVRGIVAFLTTAAAASAYLLFAPMPKPEPTVPYVILPYDSVGAAFAQIRAEGQHALLAWQGMRGEGRAAVIDLKRDKLAGDPLDLGNWSELLEVIGLSRGGGHIVAHNDYDGHDDWALFTIDLESGKVLWQHKSDAAGHGQAIVLRDTVVIVEASREDGSGGHVKALDARTGSPKWTVDEPIRHLLITEDDRLGLLQPDGVLRVRDAATGRLLSQRSGITPTESPDLIFGDFLYRSTDYGLYRAPLSGEAPLEQMTRLRLADLGMCGRYLCAGDPDGIETTAFDLKSGREVRRLTARMNGKPQLSGRGMIMASGTAENSSVIFDMDGNQIGPPSVSQRRAQWVGDDHVLLVRQIPSTDSVPNLTAEPGNVRTRSELSLYSFPEGKTKPLGEEVLHGVCGGSVGKFVCPTDTGFTLYH